MTVTMTGWETLFVLGTVFMLGYILPVITESCKDLYKWIRGGKRD